jgi:hypothetical protein
MSDGSVKDDGDIKIGAVARRFQIEGDFVQATPYGSGHINDTYCVIFDRLGVASRWILQRINHKIFRNPAALMENIERATKHLAAQVEREPDRRRRVLTLIPARDGQGWHVDSEGHYWRTYSFIERARTYDVIESAEQAFQAARAFGRFQELLVELPAPRLHDTIPDFHHTPKRFQVLQQAIHADAAGRVNQAKREIEFALSRQHIVGTLLDAGLSV